MWVEGILQYFEMKNPKVKIRPFLLSDGGCEYEKQHWNNATLFEAVKGLKPYDLQLSALDLGVTVWKDGDYVSNLLFHMKRIQEADMSYPIIQHPDGWILDGWHRICRAILEGRTTIKCVRLEKMPPPDSEDK